MQRQRAKEVVHARHAAAHERACTVDARPFNDNLRRLKIRRLIRLLGRQIKRGAVGDGDLRWRTKVLYAVNGQRALLDFDFAAEGRHRRIRAEVERRLARAGLDDLRRARIRRAVGVGVVVRAVAHVHVGGMDGKE